MTAQRLTARPAPANAAIGNAVSRTVLSVVRILIASYFLATATGLVFDASSRTFFDAVLPGQTAQLVATIYLFVTAFAIMVGKAVRPAALLLAIYIFWSGFVHYEFGADAAALSAFWRDMALLGAILLIAVTEPGGSSKFSLWRKKPIAPRRIATARSTDRPIRPNRTEDQLTRDAILSGAFIAQLSETPAPAAAPAPASNFFAATEDDDTETDNIFADLWDNRGAAKAGALTMAAA